MHTNKEFRRSSKQFRALGNERRLYLLTLLQRRSWTVDELARELGIHHASVTKHLQRLMDVGLIEGKRRGRNVDFSFSRTVQLPDSFWQQVRSGPIA